MEVSFKRKLMIMRASRRSHRCKKNEIYGFKGRGASGVGKRSRNILIRPNILEVHRERIELVRYSTREHTPVLSLDEFLGDVP